VSSSVRSHSSREWSAPDFSPATSFYYTRVESLSATSNPCSVSIAELIPPGLDRLVLTSYLVEVDWLLESCPWLHKVSCVFVHGDRSMTATVVPSFPNCMFRCAETHVPYGLHHSKVLFGFYPAFMRVVISTGNLIRADFERKTNGIWSQDFPLHTEKTRSQPQSAEAADFLLTLQDYLLHIKLRPLSELLAQYDYSQVKVALISSIPGYHQQSKMDLHKYGHMKLRRLLRTQCAMPKDALGTPIVAQFSSCGRITEKWLAEFATSCSHHTETRLPDVQLVWPSTEFVRDCIDGYEAGGSLCMPRRNLDAVVRSRLHHYRPSHPAHEHIPPHIKCYTRVGRRFGHLPWYCLTSANLSSAAWGALQKNQTQLFVRHFELGVLFLPQLAGRPHFYHAQGHYNVSINTSSENNNAGRPIGCERDSDSGSAAAAVCFSLPYCYPPPVYQGDEEPWDFETPRFEPDVHGRAFVRQ